MDTKDLLKQLNSTGVEVENDQSSSKPRAEYKPCHCKILKASFEEAGNTSVDNRLLQKESMKGRIFLVLWMEVTPQDSHKYNYLAVGKCLTSQGKPATYGTFTSSDGTVVAGTLLHDIIHAYRESHAEDKVFSEGWNLNAATFKGLEFDMECKEVTTKDGEDIIILRTSYQDFVDEQRRKANQEQQEDYSNFNPNSNETEEMPF